jgi:hypothetical protein
MRYPSRKREKPLKVRTKAAALIPIYGVTLIDTGKAAR